MPHDVATALRSDIAALQYKRDRLLSEVRIFFLNKQEHWNAEIHNSQTVESSA